MSLASDKGLGKRARREVSERLRAYHEAVIRMIEPESEAFFDRVLERAKNEHGGFGATQAAEPAQI